MSEPEVMWQGRFIAVVRDGQWEYVRRARGIRAVVILADTDDGHIILVEQHRVPIGRRCLELPAGLIGDGDGEDSVDSAARRELEEETGFTADSIEPLGDYYSSPGMVSEGFTLVRAHGLTNTGGGGGIDGEDIAVHLVPRAEVASFVEERRAAGVGIDVKLLLLLGSSILA